MKYEDRFLAQLYILIPINLSKLKHEDAFHVYDAYRTDLQTHEEFTLEVKRLKARWELYPTDQINPSNPCETLELVYQNVYPNIYCILKILLTMSPSTATTERSFSLFETCKDIYLLSTKGQEILSALVLLLAYTQIHSASIGCSCRQV